MSIFTLQEGFSTIEEIAYVPTNELLSVEEFDEDIVKELRNRARDVLLTQAIASEESADGSPSDDLMSLEGMDEELVAALSERGITTREELAEQAVDDLEGIESLDPARASQLIMAARAHWFTEETAS